VEAALTSLPGVREALVFAVPDPRWGQRVAAAIIPEGTIDLSVLRRALEGKLAGHKRPRLVCLADHLPVGSTGKVLRREALPLFGERLVPWESEPPAR
jgi:acyl-CoA synthetase (AMP-forming)/AMP-acid ligase II